MRILILGAIYAISTKRQPGKLASEAEEQRGTAAPGRVYSLCNASYGDTTNRSSVDAESPAMAELTLDVSDELMQRLQPLQDRLPALLTLLVGALPSQAAGAPPTEVHGTEPPLAYMEVLDFLLTRPTPHDILAFKVSDAAQARLRLLLDKNREEALSVPEEAELDIYEQLEHLMLLLKAKAYALASRP